MTMEDSAAVLTKFKKKIKKLEASGEDAAKLVKLQKKLKKLSAAQGGDSQTPKSASKRAGLQS